MNKDDFPPIFHAPNPIFDDSSIGASLYVARPDSLEAVRDQVPDNYYDFYKNIDARLADISRHARIKEVAAWIDSLASCLKLLEIHDNDFFNRDKPVFSKYYIQFTKHHRYSEWKDQSPSYGINLELVDTPVGHLPEALQDVYKLGALWLFGVPCSGYFYHPRNIQKALDEEYLGEYISDEEFRDLNYPLDELMVFYADSGCWLMYDKAENVYCGGVECGDFYRSSKKLPEVIAIIFTELLHSDERRLSIECFAPRDED